MNLPNRVDSYLLWCQLWNIIWTHHNYTCYVIILTLQIHSSRMNRKDFLTKSDTACKLVNSRLGHAVCEHSRKLQDDTNHCVKFLTIEEIIETKTSIATHLQFNKRQFNFCRKTQTHWSLAIYTGHVYNRALALNQMRHTQVCKVINWSETHKGFKRFQARQKFPQNS